MVSCTYSIAKTRIPQSSTRRSDVRFRAEVSDLWAEQRMDRILMDHGITISYRYDLKFSFVNSQDQQRSKKTSKRSWVTNTPIPGLYCAISFDTYLRVKRKKKTTLIYVMVSVNLLLTLNYNIHKHLVDFTTRVLCFFPLLLLWSIAKVTDSRVGMRFWK